MYQRFIDHIRREQNINQLKTGMVQIVVLVKGTIIDDKAVALSDDPPVAVQHMDAASLQNIEKSWEWYSFSFWSYTKSLIFSSLRSDLFIFMIKTPP